MIDKYTQVYYQTTLRIYQQRCHGNTLVPLLTPFLLTPAWTTERNAKLFIAAGEPDLEIQNEAIALVSMGYYLGFLGNRCGDCPK